MTDAAPCTPVSWLRLEGYALGELGAAERDDVAAHLSTCARCRACADEIANDARVLPPLPDLAPTTASSSARSTLSPHRGRPRWPWKARARAFALTATAAAAALVFALRPSEPPAQRHGSGVRVVAIKGGGDVAIEVVRERDGVIALEPTSFAPGDRFKLLVTCPPPLRLHADIVVLQNDGAAYPGEPAVIPCGNRVPVPPPFRITGSGGATICVGLDPSAPPSRVSLAMGESAPVTHACLRLDRAE